MFLALTERVAALVSIDRLGAHPGLVQPELVRIVRARARTPSRLDAMDK